MRADISQGLRDTWAAAIGLIPLGLAFGLLMVQSGFSWWWTPIFSLVIYAGSMEFLAISMVTGGASAFASLVTGFMVNFRHIFYGLTFPPPPHRHPQRGPPPPPHQQTMGRV